jgi:hypothetical protein
MNLDENTDNMFFEEYGYFAVLDSVHGQAFQNTDRWEPCYVFSYI